MKKLLPIAKKMLDENLEEKFIADTLRTAISFEGMADLMHLWNKNISDRNEIVKDIKDLLKECLCTFQKMPSTVIKSGALSTTLRRPKVCIYKMPNGGINISFNKYFVEVVNIKTCKYLNLHFSSIRNAITFQFSKQRISNESTILSEDSKGRKVGAIKTFLIYFKIKIKRSKTFYPEIDNKTGYCMIYL